MSWMDDAYLGKRIEFIKRTLEVVECIESPIEEYPIRLKDINTGDTFRMTTYDLDMKLKKEAV